MVKEKLKRLNLFLKQWKHEEFGNVNNQIAALRSNISAIDLREEQGQSTTYERKQRADDLCRLHQLLWLQDSMWRQRARVFWGPGVGWLLRFRDFCWLAVFVFLIECLSCVLLLLLRVVAILFVSFDICCRC
ncbi:hypothetical protein Ancab_040657 [Ancistrocladus abbreviatus]